MRVQQRQRSAEGSALSVDADDAMAKSYRAAVEDKMRRVGRARDGRGLGDRRDEGAGAAEGEGGDDSLHDLFFFCARGPN